MVRDLLSVALGRAVKGKRVRACPQLYRILTRSALHAAGGDRRSLGQRASVPTGGMEGGASQDSIELWTRTNAFPLYSSTKRHAKEVPNHEHADPRCSSN